MTPLLSAALIVRDESAFLEGCIESVAPVVDEIVVVDTGSVDGTPEIARRLGAVVVHHPWRDNFAEARNVSLELAKGEWILYIDADERLENTDRERIRAVLTTAREVAFRVLLRPTLDATAYREYRLWRSDPRIRFEGIIHEKVVPSIHLVADRDGRPIGNADLMLVHHGYEGDQTRKHQRNLPLLKRQLAIEPENLFAWHHLARVQEGLGDPSEAERTLTTAVEIARSMRTSNPVACLSYADLIRLRMQRGEEADQLLAEGLRTFPDNCVLLWIKSESLIDKGDYTSAIETLDQILRIDWIRQPDSGPAYNKRLIGELPLGAKALCLFRLGRFEEAAETYAAAARLAPSDPSYSVKETLARGRAAQDQGSLARSQTGR